MTEHLPECQRYFTDMPAPDECPACEMFRVCEQRVRDESTDALTITRGVNYAHGYSDGYAKARKDAYGAGLDAAREAVAGMNLPSGITYLVGTDRRDLAEMVRRAALDLIDALRGQPQDKTSVQRSFEKSLDSDSTLTRAQVARLEKAAALAAIDALRGES